MGAYMPTKSKHNNGGQPTFMIVGTTFPIPYTGVVMTNPGSLKNYRHNLEST